jgi:phosphoribosylaminoimidazole carboxylase
MKNSKFPLKYHNYHSYFAFSLVQINNLASAERAGEVFGYPLMIKSKRLAYDGRGNAVAHRKEDLPSIVNCKYLQQ